MKKWDGFDKAILGATLTWQEGERVTVLVYEGDRLAKILKERDGMGWDEALDFIDFNLEGGYIGKDTPLILWELPVDWEELDL